MEPTSQKDWEKTPGTREMVALATSRGAVALAVNGEPHNIIKKIRRWSSNTFLMYVHKQISHLTVGVAERMATTFLFTKIEGVTTSGGQGTD